MLTNVAVVAPIGAAFPDLNMAVQKPSPANPLFVRRISGIEPVTAAVVTKDYNLLDGEFYVSARLPKRNIVLTLGLNDVEVALPLVYAYMMTKSAVTLRFDVDGYPNKSVFIDGYVEDTPFEHFEQDPEIQISIICPDPYFKSAPFTVEGTSTDDDEDPGVEIEYQGNAIAGFDLSLDIGGTGINGDLYVEATNAEVFLPGFRYFKLEDVIIAHDKTFYINTRRGEKTVEYQPIDVGSKNGLLWKMSNDSFWLTLWPGTNYVRVRHPTSGTARDWVLNYTELFGGI
jgi:hypothetical protein